MGSLLRDAQGTTDLAPGGPSSTSTERGAVLCLDSAQDLPAGFLEALQFVRLALSVLGATGSSGRGFFLGATGSKFGCTSRSRSTPASRLLCM